jgi:hypothetical protein
LLDLLPGIGASKPMTSKIVNVVEDPDTGDLMLDLGVELCAELGWQEGDTLEWTDNKDGSWLIQKTSPSQA